MRDGLYNMYMKTHGFISESLFSFMPLMLLPSTEYLHLEDALLTSRILTNTIPEIVQRALASYLHSGKRACRLKQNAGSLNRKVLSERRVYVAGNITETTQP